VRKNRTQARQIMEKLGYGADNRLHIKVTTRDVPYFRDAAVILIDQLKEVYIDGSGPDPDQILDLSYGCGSSLNWDGYCNPEVDQLIEQQSIEADEARRKQLLWAIEKKLAEASARPIIFYSRQGSCWQPYVKGLTIMVNSVFNGWRMDDAWLDK